MSSWNWHHGDRAIVSDPHGTVEAHGVYVGSTLSPFVWARPETLEIKLDGTGQVVEAPFAWVRGEPGDLGRLIEKALARAEARKEASDAGRDHAHG